MVVIHKLNYTYASVTMQSLSNILDGTATKQIKLNYEIKKQSLL